MPDAGAADASAKHHLRHLRRRVREEAEVAADAAGLNATLAHLELATSYARRLREQIRDVADSVVRAAP